MLVLVTVFALWLAWELYWIRERHALLQDENVYISSVGLSWKGASRWPLSWFGESGIGTAIILPSEATDAELARARWLFPETSVTRWSRPIAH